MCKYLLNSTLVATYIFLSVLGVSVPVMADDTDIYVDPSQPEPAEPLVMLMLDLRANVGSTICGNNDDISVAAVVANCGYSDEVAKAILANGGLSATDDVVSLYDQVLGAVRVVVGNLTGVKVGLMVPHEAEGDCNGPTHGEAATAGNECSNGAFIAKGLQSLPAGAEALFDVLEVIEEPSPANKQHPYQFTELMFEYYRYLTGQLIYNGHNGWTDFNTSTSYNLNTEPDDDTPVDWDASTTGDDAPVETGSGNSFRYVSPYSTSNACADAYAIHINFGTNNGFNTTDDKPPIEAAVTDGGLGTTISNSTPASDILVHMQSTDLIPDTTTGDIPVTATGIQNVTTYIVAKTTNLKQNGWAQDGQGNASVSATSLSDDPDAMIDEITAIFDEILSISTTFVAPSVPVNVFNRAQVVDEVFLALFDADEDKKPFWPGNLKKLRVDFDLLTLVDAAGNNAIDPVDGRILTSTLSIWTDSTDGNLTLADPDGDADAGKDGRAVMRGGAGQQIPGYINDTTTAPGAANSTTTAVTRQLFTEAATLTSPPGTNNNLFDLNANAAKAIALWPEITRDWNPAATASTHGAATAAEQAKALNILEYSRGLEDDGSTSRGWFMADPLHSQPLTINYGERGSYDDSATDPDNLNDNSDLRIFFGTNDGYFHFIKNTTSATTGDESGEEVWAFMPRELKPLADEIKNNVDNGTPIHPITADGSGAALIIDANSDGIIDTSVTAVTGPPAVAAGTNDKVIIFVGLRRGGKSYYALDATNPDSPVLLWTISKYADPVTKTTVDDATCTAASGTFATDAGKGCYNTDFIELGQTWSRPIVVKLDYGHADGARSVLIFGGGYNGDDRGDDIFDTTPTEIDYGKDQANRDRKNGLMGVSNISIGTDDVEGNAIFIVDALTGALVWKATDGATAGHSGKTLRVPKMLDSIVAEMVAFDSTGNSLVDRAYVGDLGGRVWRIDLVGDDPSSWAVTSILNVGRHFASADKSTDRRFFNRVDVASTLDSTGDFDAIIIGSGDREDPKADETTNAFYMYKDRVVVSTNSPTITELKPTDLADLTTNCAQDDTCSDATNDDLVNGWFIELEDDGEKNLAPSLTLGGKVIFTTFSPNSVPLTCDLSEGLGRQYIVDLFDATAVQNFDTTNDSGGEVLATSDRSDLLESGGIPVEAVPLGEGFILMQGQTSGGVGGVGGTVQNIEIGTYWKTFWYEDQEE